MRSVILIADANGHITRYVPQQQPQPAVPAQLTVPAQRIAQIGQIPLQQPVVAQSQAQQPIQNVSQPSATPKCDEMAAKMSKCTVPVLLLSDAKVKEINAELARAGKIRSYEAKLKIMPRKIFFSTNIFRLF